jgi:hypothetical protein
MPHRRKPKPRSQREQAPTEEKVEKEEKKTPEEIIADLNNKVFQHLQRHFIRDLARHILDYCASKLVVSLPFAPLHMPESLNNLLRYGKKKIGETFTTSESIALFLKRMMAVAPVFSCKIGFGFHEFPYVDVWSSFLRGELCLGCLHYVEGHAKQCPWMGQDDAKLADGAGPSELQLCYGQYSYVFINGRYEECRLFTETVGVAFIFIPTKNQIVAAFSRLFETPSSKMFETPPLKINFEFRVI